MFKKIFRAVKNTVIGSIKGLPIINLIGEMKDLNRKDVADQMRQIAQYDPENHSALKQHVYRFADIMDDGKQNESFQMVMIDKIFQLLGSLATGGFILYELIKTGI